MVYRREIDIGGSTLYIRKDRLELMQFIQLYTHTR